MLAYEDRARRAEHVGARREHERPRTDSPAATAVRPTRADGVASHASSPRCSATEAGSRSTANHPTMPTNISPMGQCITTPAVTNRMPAQTPGSPRASRIATAPAATRIPSTSALSRWLRAVIANGNEIATGDRVDGRGPPRLGERA